LLPSIKIIIHQIIKLTKQLAISDTAVSLANQDVYLLVVRCSFRNRLENPANAEAMHAENLST
jgi:hypothetical protein